MAGAVPPSPFPPPPSGTTAGVPTHSAWSGRRPNPTRPVVHPTLVGLAFQAGRLQRTACGPAFALPASALPASALRVYGGRGAEASACRIWLPESARAAQLNIQQPTRNIQ